MIRDLRIACRSLLRRPTFTLTVVATLAVGIGANAAIFSVVDAVVLRPLPFPDAERLAAVFQTVDRGTVERRAFSYPDFLAASEGVKGFEAMGAYGAVVHRLTGEERTERLRGERVSPSYFGILGSPPALGRGLTPRRGIDGDLGREVVVSHALWMRAWGGDPEILGRTVWLDDQPHTVVGVAPEGFAGAQDGAEVWTSLLDADPAVLADRRNRDLGVVARLAQGASLELANRQLAAVFDGSGEGGQAGSDGYGAAAVSLHDDRLGSLRRPVLLLLGAVGLLLLIACANVTNLLLVQAVRARRQSAICVALGARPRDLARRSIVEALVLGLVGGFLGVVLAAWGLAGLTHLSPVTLPVHAAVDLDLRALGFSVLLALAVGGLLGLVSGWRHVASGVAPWLRDRSRGGRRGGWGARRGLVAAEVALALLVTSGSGLMLQSWRQLHAVDPGFDTREAAVLRFTVPGDAAERRRVHRRVLAALRSEPGVQGATLASDVPLSEGYRAVVVSAEGAARRPDATYGGGVRTYRHHVDDDYFHTLGIPIVAGRALDRRDQSEDGPTRAVVSRGLADRLWPGADPIGKRFKGGVPPEPGAGEGVRWLEVVGVAGEVRHRTLVPDAAGVAEDPDLYLPLGWRPPSTAAAVVHLRGEAAPRLPGLARLLEAVHPGMPVFDPSVLGDHLQEQTSRSRFGTALMGLFGILSLLLAAVGIYGVLTCQIDERRQEIGIRMALGAARRRVVREVVVEGMAMVGVGLVAGWALAALAAGLLAGVLYGVQPRDPATLLTTGGALALVALAACALPAFRASRVDPLVALRHD